MTADAQNLLLKIEAALSEVFANHGSLLNKYVLIAETVGEEGRHCMVTLSDDLRTWETLGMLEWARRLVDAASDVALFGGSDDEDDENG